MTKQKLTYYSIFLNRSGKIETEKGEYNVVAKNDTCLVINNSIFSTLYPKDSDKKYHTSFPIVNDINAYKRDWGGSLSHYDGYGCSTYTDLPEAEILKKMKSKLKKRIQQDVWFSNTILDNLDLAFEKIKA